MSVIFFIELHVRDLVGQVNAKQGFRLKGCFKPAVSGNGVTQETF